MNKLSQNEFKALKREKLLDYKVYQYNFDEPIAGFDIVRASLALPPETLANVHPYDLKQATHQRAIDGLTLLANAYSGGHAVEELAAYYPAVLEFWEVYARYSVAANVSEGTAVAHIPLLDSNFVYANRLLSLAVLLGWSSLVRRIPPLIDYNNPERDGMLERLLLPFVSNRQEMQSECTKHLPYFKTLKIFNAAADQRAALMKEYLQEWYEASRREPYYNSHKKGMSFLGYWSWEAAAITYLLDIDDSSFSDAEFYPADLVAFARRFNVANRNSPVAVSDNELRAKSGELCPKTGEWETLDIPTQRRQFALGDLLESANAAYGVTVWRFITK